MIFNNINPHKSFFLQSKRTLGSNPPIIRGVEIVQRRRGEKQEEDEMDSSYIDKKLKSSWVPSSLPLRIDLDLPMDEFSLVLGELILIYFINPATRRPLLFFSYN